MIKEKEKSEQPIITAKKERSAQSTPNLALT